MPRCQPLSSAVKVPFLRLRFHLLALVLALVAGVALSACSDGSRTQIRIVGSSTVYPFTTAVAEQFKRAWPQYPAPIVESTGTGGGIKLLCAGVGQQYPDLADASRRIKASELAECARNGVKSVVEIQIGLDGLVIAQSRGANFPSLSERDVYLALAAQPFGRGPNQARLWSDVNPALPSIRIEVIGPPPTSGTRDSFDTLFMTKGCETEPAMQALKARDETQFTMVCSRIREDGAYMEGGENDNLIVQKIAANPNLLGVFGFSYLEENSDKIKDVPLNGVAATYDNISNFRYPASRALYLYVKPQHERAVRGLRAFLAEYAHESTWGRQGYLARRGLVASPDADRMRNASIAHELTPLDPAAIR
jgi:phosphate transport system substrate-binding protein